MVFLLGVAAWHGRIDSTRAMGPCGRRTCQKTRSARHFIRISLLVSAAQGTSIYYLCISVDECCCGHHLPSHVCIIIVIIDANSGEFRVVFFLLRWENRHKTPLYHFLSLGVCAHLAINVLFTLCLLSISGTNYPGGVAISHLNRLGAKLSDENGGSSGGPQQVHVHIANLAAQTGVTRFTQIHTDWM